MGIAHEVAEGPHRGGDGEVRSVAVVVRARGADGRLEHGFQISTGNAAKPGQLGAKDVVLEADLSFVPDVLPLATPARAEVWAKRLHAQGRRLDNLRNQPPDQVLAVSGDCHP